MTRTRLLPLVLAIAMVGSTHLAFAAGGGGGAGVAEVQVAPVGEGHQVQAPAELHPGLQLAVRARRACQVPDQPAPASRVSTVFRRVQQTRRA
jgi:hypothetical protein